MNDGILMTVNNVTPNMYKKAFNNFIVPDFLSSHKLKIKQEN